MTLSSYNQVSIDETALAANYRLLTSRVGESVRVLAMVKSDAYGHGLVPAARAFARAGCRDFGVAEIGEGVELRESGCRGEIFIFLGCAAEQIDYYFSHRLTPVVFSRDDLNVLAEMARRRGEKIGVYLKFDCGMARLGFDPDMAAAVARYCMELPEIEVIGVISHYPCADDPAASSNEAVAEAFAAAIEPFYRSPGFVRSLCNSGGTLYLPETHGDLVRAGIALYGYYPDGPSGRPPSGNPALRPALSFATTILQINKVKAGRGISYGHTYHAPHDMRLAVLPVGYSDGYLRCLSNRAEVLIGGRRAPVRGRICMNLCMADVTDIPTARAGDEAVLLGRQQEQTIDADEIAGWCETISYEILCALGNNNERSYHQSP
ncbi:alanine racemase [Desulfofustis glycolicus]|uniref:Alanine racemase n=1 Tax=Desulfofustis glycolicus DSM 9705 TaxID=1121409 RepID=A0A1M5W880_9BACT|nr:alanine racemase [Desulfofustis glycolicus]SHH83671.1 alanine racemase [Desulfofustis glycolicus DSM 9705]